MNVIWSIKLNDYIKNIKIVDAKVYGDDDEKKWIRDHRMVIADLVF